MSKEPEKKEGEQEAAEEVVFEEEEDTENPKTALKKLREKLKLSQAERQEYLAISQRLKADYVNLKRDEEKLREVSAKYAKQDLLLELIDVADNFELAMANKEAWEAVPVNWRQGVEYIYSKLKAILSQHGLAEINPLNEIFNPERHHSVGVIDTDEADKDNKVLAVFQKGYKLHERVIRPAKVKVGHKV